MLGFFRMLNVLGAAIINYVSRPIDCVVKSAPMFARAIWRYLFSLFVPMSVIALLSIYWGYRSIVTYGAGSLYFLRRVLLVAITVTYITYFDLTQTAVKAFNCVLVYDNNDRLSDSFTRYWIQDTSVECYKDDHVVLVGIALVVLILVSTCFPLFCSVALYRRRYNVEQSNSRAHETLGLLCGPFKKKFIFWECITMIKKALLSVTIVFSYSLGNQVQGLLISLTLIFFLSLHTICFPFKEEFNRLNYYESSSLFISCATYTIIQFFNVDSLSSTTRSLVSISLIILNGGFVIFMGLLIARNLIRLARAILLAKNVEVPNDMRWVSILKLYVRNIGSSIDTT